MSYDRLPSDEHQALETGPPKSRFDRNKIIIAASLSLNIVLALALLLTSSSVELERSPYAGLARDVPTQLRWTTEYSDPANADRDKTWFSGEYDRILEFEMIALDREQSDALSLPPSEVPFVWETSKGTYAIEAHHSLHCLQLIYRAVLEYRTGVEQYSLHQHIVHCLDNLRQNVICEADDTPRFLTANGTHSGENQIRMCRSFDKLNEWAAKHDACYKFIHSPEPDMAEVERYKYCKSEGVNMDKVRKFFGLSSVWQPFPYQEQDTFLTKADLKQKMKEMPLSEKIELGLE